MEQMLLLLQKLLNHIQSFPELFIP
jgi:NAD(P)-dependent dehydrogenase (short-subunit alcohol dehydrogenase family)